MRIAVNTHLLTQKEPRSYTRFVNEIFFRLATQNPGDEFFFIGSQQFIGVFSDLRNCEVVVVEKDSTTNILLRFWWQFKLAGLLKKYKVDVFVTDQWNCSSYTSVPQVIAISDVEASYSLQAKKTPFTPGVSLKSVLKKAAVLTTFCEIVRQRLISDYKQKGGSILVTPGAASTMFSPIEWEEKEKIKEQYAMGCEYFVFAGEHLTPKAIHTLLKAFSLFKKRQHTNMKLLVAGNLAEGAVKGSGSLEQYKFKKELIVTGVLTNEDFAKVLAAAYAIVYPVANEGLNLPVFEAMKSAVPVITADTRGMHEITNEAALYVNPADPTSIAEQMKLVFKDENLRSRLMEKGLVAVQNFDWDKSAGMMWSAIQLAVAK